MEAVMMAEMALLFESSLPPQVTHLREKGRLHVCKNNKCESLHQLSMTKVVVLCSLNSFNMKIDGFYHLNIKILWYKNLITITLQLRKVITAHFNL